MIKKALLFLVVLALAAAGLIVALGSEVFAARRPVTYELIRKVNLDDNAVKQMLSAGWKLGGVYRDCGEGSGDVVISMNIDRLLIPFYEQLLEHNKREMLALLGKQFSASRAQDIVKKISAGKDKLTNYGNVGEYQTLQKEFDRLNQIMADVGDAPAPEGVADIDDLLARLEKFVKSGGVADINGARQAILGIQTVIEKQPGQLLSDDMSNAENIERLENARKIITDALGRIEQLGGSGCRMTYVFYKAK